MNIYLAAAHHTNTQPGWGKLLALLGGIALCVVVVKVWDRFKAVKDGTEVNPFSPDDPQAPEAPQAQLSTPDEAPKTTSGKGLGKWFRKG